jgi:hypothetical protein
VALGLVFVALFAVANPVIVRWGNQIGDMFDALTRFAAPGRVLLWLLVGLWSWALLRGRARASRQPTIISFDVVAPVAPFGVNHRLTISLVVRCLVVFNIVFLVQNGLDGMYLFGGAALPKGVTYAQYAHRGAYPLIIAALLAGLFVLTTFRPGSSAQGHAICRRLVYAWLGQTVILTFSSVWRLGLYVEVFSLTRWRLAAGLWMILVAVGLISIVRRIAASKSNAWLWRVNALALALLLYVGSFVNFDGAIAQYNVRHCLQITGRGAALDLKYLEHLGPESLPALDWFIRATADDRPARIIRNRVGAKLKQDLSNWRGWS